MKKDYKLRKASLYFGAISFALLGTYIALITYKYIIVVRGILGFLAVFMTIQYARSIRIDAPINELLSHPKIYKSFIYAFGCAVIFSWAIQEIYKMLEFLTESIIPF